MGLIKPLRDKNERRVYTDSDIDLLVFITKMRDTHMSIAKIKNYIELYSEGENSLEERKELLVEHLKYIQTQILDLQDVEQFILLKMKNYYTHGMCSNTK